MPLNFQQVPQHLDHFDFQSHFIQELGSNPSGKTAIRAEVEGVTYEA